MSHRASYWAISRDGLTPVQKLTLMALADCHNGQTGECFPAIDTLARVVNVSRSTVKRALRDLEGFGLITKREARTGGGGQKSNRYDLHVTDRETGAENVPATAEHGGVNLNPPRFTHDPPPVHPRPPNREDNRETKQRASPFVCKRATLLPENWTPSQQEIDYAAEKGLDHDEIERTVEDFREYWAMQPDDKARKRDWPSAWRFWVRRAADNARHRRRSIMGSVRSRDPSEIARNVARAVVDQRLRGAQ